MMLDPIANITEADEATEAMTGNNPIVEPEEEIDKDALLRKLKRWHHEDSEHDSDWRKKAIEDYGFVAGEEKQWDPDDITALKEALRPIITFNRIDPLIRSVQGEQINNAQEIRFVPRTEGDIKPNELLTAAAEWVRDQCDAEDEDSEAFWDMLVCGKGWSETRIDLDDDPEEPNAKVERIDPFEMLADKNSRKRNYTDARRIWRVKSSIPIEEARDLYPDFADSDLDATWARMSEIGKIGDDADDYNDNITAEKGSKETVTIVQCQWWERRTYYKVVDPFTGQMAELKEDEFERVSGRVKKLGLELPHVKLRRKVFKQAFIGRTILKVKDSACPDRFTFGAITGFRDRNDGQWYGLVRAMKDPQRWANKWLSQALHIMNTSAKGGVMMEDGAVDDMKKFKESWSKTDAVTVVPEGSLSSPNGPKIQPKPVSQFPQSFFQIMQFAIDSIPSVSGVSQEMMGLRAADQPASLEYQRKQAGITILAPLFKSMRNYHRSQGRVLLYFIQNYLSDGRLIKVVGEENSKFVPLVKQAAEKYDIIVDDGPTSPNQKERVWGLIGANFWKLPPTIQMALLEYSPFPSSVVEKVKAATKEASSGPQAQMQQQMAQLEMKLKQIEGALKEAETQKTQAETAQIASEIGKPQGTDGVTDKGNDPMKAIVDLTKAREGNQVDLQKHREGLAAQSGMAREKMAGDAQIAREKSAADAEKAMMQTALTEMFRPEPQSTQETV